ncbi:MAG: hypothetical protein KDB07_07560, partial [Planctomycetes bacterium]|nr:hypothetical protein [Planctomycetota bacterium]
EALEERDELSGETRVVLSETESYYQPSKLVTERLLEWTSSDDESLARWATMALARSGEFDRVSAKVKEIAEGAGEMATYAQILLDNQETTRELKAASIATKDVHEVSEGVQALLTHYDGSNFTYAQESLSLNVTNLLDNAYRGMAESLDRYSTVMTSAEYNKQQESNSNSYAGIGAYVTKDDDDPAIRISQPIYSGPAYAAGLRSGDYLWKVQLDGGKEISLEGMSVADGIKILKGPAGTKIKLWVKRPGAKDLVLLELTRAQVQTDPAPAEMLPAGIGYLRLKQFGDRNTTLSFYRSMLRLTKDEGAKGVILDLRGNPGGLLPTVMAISGLLLDKGVKVTTVRGVFPPYNEDTTLETNLETPLFKDVPMVVLIDGTSASGSELLSGTLQDHKRAKLIGEPSFGKGIGQSFYPVTEAQTYDRRSGMPTGAGLTRELKKPEGRVLKVTVFDYYIEPSGRSIDLYSPTPSVRPDIEVHNPLLSSWEVKYSQALAKTEKLDTWVRENWDKHKNVFLEIA